MGYDMYVANPSDPDAQQRKEEAYKIAIAAERGSEAARLAWEEYDAANIDYYRLNIWGMGDARARMMEAGILVDGGQSAGRWPDPVEYGVAIRNEEGRLEWPEWSENAFEYVYDGNQIPDDIFTPEQIESVMAYFEAENSVRNDSYSDDPQGIPIYKLCSNDGWLVTPEEIVAGLSHVDMDEIRQKLQEEKNKPDSEENLAWYYGFLVWMDEASRNGGFKVY